MERLQPHWEEVRFDSAGGPLLVRRGNDGYVMDLPARRCVPVEEPEGLAQALGIQPLETLWDGFNYLARFQRAEDVRHMRPHLDAIGRLPCAGVIVTAEGDHGYDCVSRYFAPRRASLKIL
jgi:predicted PhzF superfamily epimerase YddE/YHI9